MWPLQAEQQLGNKSKTVCNCKIQKAESKGIARPFWISFSVLKAPLEVGILLLRPHDEEEEGASEIEESSWRGLLPGLAFQPLGVAFPRPTTTVDLPEARREKAEEESSLDCIGSE